VATAKATGQPDKVVLLVGIVFGFFAIPPLARANPALVNGFLTLVLFSSLLINRDRWLPYLNQLGGAASGTGGGGGSRPNKVL
jgi:hypothetical protein